MPLNRNQDFMFEDTTTLTTNAQSLKGALNEVNASLASKANQSDLTTTNTNVASNASAITDNAKQITDRIISAKDKQFGAKGDGTTDDTTALQNFINYIVPNHLYGIIPAGTFKITSALNVPCGYEWVITGAGAGVTTIKQYTDNIAIFNLGYDASSTPCHTVTVSDVTWQYANSQSGKTNAIPMLFTASYYESTFKRMRFNGYYGIRIVPGQVGFWGCLLDELDFTNGLYGGAMDWNGVVNGIPNNKFGRIFNDGLNMVGPIYNNIRGYNWLIDNIEFINTQKGAQLLLFQAGSECTIGAIKLENGTYTTAQDLIVMNNACKIKIGQFFLGGNNMVITPSGGNIRIFKTDTGGSTGWLEIDSVNVSATTFSGNVYLLEGNTGGMVIKNLVTDSKNWQLSNIGSAASAETINVGNWNNNRLSQNKGDGDYTITLGDPNNISFETTLTATRTVNLPSNNNNLFNGLRYRIRTYGAVNGTNVINIVCNGTTKATLSVDKTIIELMYRRNPSNAQGGWIVIGYNTLP